MGEQWRVMAREWFPWLAGTGLRQPSWGEIAVHHDRIGEMLDVVPVSVIWQRLRDEQGLEASVASVRRYVRAHFPERAARAGVAPWRPPVPPGGEAQVDYGYHLGLWPDPRTGRRRREWAYGGDQVIPHPLNQRASGHEKIRVCGQLAPGSRPSFLQSCGH